MPGAEDIPVSPQEAAGLLHLLAAHDRVALAVSGGPDSMALMVLASRWAKQEKRAPELVVLTVDHGLRAEAAGEARFVCEQAEALGLACHVLRWEGDKPRTGIQQAAREARYRLLGAWCGNHGAALATAHTQEDQAETLLMRLARGSGLNGLAAMASESILHAGGTDVPLLRPLLDVPRARLRATLKAAGARWIDDPSNENVTFERVRVRKTLARLEPLGLTARALALSAHRLGRARTALEAWQKMFLERHFVCHEEGWGEVAMEPLRALPAEMRLRVLTHLARCFGSGGRVRLEKLERLERWLVEEATRARVLGGARFVRRKAVLLAGREPGRLASCSVLSPQRPHTLWDGRFEITIEELTRPLTVRALGEMLKGDCELPERTGTLPAFVWRSLPAICDGDRVLAVPFVGWRASRGAPASVSVRFVGCRRLAGGLSA